MWGGKNAHAQISRSGTLVNAKWPGLWVTRTFKITTLYPYRSKTYWTEVYKHTPGVSAHFKNAVVTKRSILTGVIGLPSMPLTTIKWLQVAIQHKKEHVLFNGCRQSYSFACDNTFESGFISDTQMTEHICELYFMKWFKSKYGNILL